MPQSVVHLTNELSRNHPVFKIGNPTNTAHLKPSPSARRRSARNLLYASNQYTHAAVSALNSAAGSAMAKESTVQCINSGKPAEQKSAHPQFCQLRNDVGSLPKRAIR